MAKTVWHCFLVPEFVGLNPTAHIDARIHTVSVYTVSVLGSSFQCHQTSYNRKVGKQTILKRNRKFPAVLVPLYCEIHSVWGRGQSLTLRTILQRSAHLTVIYDSNGASDITRCQSPVTLTTDDVLSITINILQLAENVKVIFRLIFDR